MALSAVLSSRVETGSYKGLCYYLVAIPAKRFWFSLVDIVLVAP